MKAILQISTGRFGQCTERSVSEVRSRLEQMLKWLPVTAVIFGWARKDGLFEAIADTAHANGADVYLWLPVYADVRDPAHADPMVFWDADHAGDRNVPVMDGEGFHFICPASGKNLDSAFRTWADLAEGISVEGVFLDRIRYPSAVFSKVHFFGCRCPNCLRRLDGQIRDREKLRRLIRDADQGMRMPLPVSVENGCCRYADADLNRLMADRRGQITHAVECIVRSFHEKGLRVGLDTFAPALADLVGQDLPRLMELSDFIKPMMYYKTDAPAGIPCELKAFGAEFTEQLSRLWDADLMSVSSMEKQLRSLKNTGKVCPGIEIHRIPGICEADEESIRDGIRAARAYGCASVVLSWNDLLASDTELEWAGKYLTEDGT